MKDLKLWVDSRRSCKESNYTIEGSSPAILNNLIDFLRNSISDIVSLDLCMYLYNNCELHTTLAELSTRGVRVRVFSIPLEGYDNNSPQYIYLRNGIDRKYATRMSKYDLANEVYSDAKDIQSEYFALYIFPHMYIRSAQVKPFSRGNMPYSLHCKSLLIELKSGEWIIGLTSSNLAVRDLPKDEIMVLGYGIDDEIIAAKDFFTGLRDNSIPVADFVETKDWLRFNILTRPVPQKCRNMYIAPFYKNSPDFFEYALQSVISKAKCRILICAQHISAFEYTFERTFKNIDDKGEKIKKEGFLTTVLEKARNGVQVFCLSQTFVDENGDSHNCRAPQNKYSFQKFIKAFTKSNNCFYGVNEDIHCKFIIADNIAVVTTCNFTPTQFIYLPFVKIDEFKNIPETEYCGIHSEVGQFIAIQDDAFCKQLSEYFFGLWDRKETFHYLARIK